MLRNLSAPAVPRGALIGSRRAAPALPAAFCVAPRCLSSAARPSGGLRCAAGALAGARSAAPVRCFSSSLRWQDETVKVPQMAESISEGTLKQWLKKAGDFVKADEEVATIETDKIDVSVNAPQSGTITETLAEEEDTVTVGQDLFKLAPGDAPAGGGAKKAEPKKEEPKAEIRDDGRQDEKPAGAKDEGEAKHKGEETSRKPEPSSEVRSARRSQQADPVEKKETEPPRQEPQTSPSRQPEARKDFKESSGGEEGGRSDKLKPFDRTERRVKMNRMRVRISERLKQSQNTAASLTTFNEVDMSSLMQMRSLYKDQVLKERGVKLGFMSAFAKAASLALKEIPTANASIEGEGAGDTIVYRDYVDLSVAVATPKGLVTPVVRNAESLGFVEIEEEIARLAKKARDGKLTLEDMAGGSFTISNGGVFGSLYGTPIINLPQSAVLGMHTIKDTPVVRDGQIVIRPIMIVALTYDHRLLDGREATTLLVKIKQYIEDPRKMLLA